MVRKKRRPKPKNKEKLDSESKRKSSDPKSPEQQVQAIADDIKAELISFIYRYALEQELTKDTVERALGRGGGKLQEFIGELESGYAKTVPNQQDNLEKEEEAELKQVSTPQSTEIVLPKDKDGNISKPSRSRSNRARK
ncbi:MAG: hypothetical protein AAFO04_24045 [Cyanobacteria bacterium J06592_8]